ncbi:MAG: hypothetical protein KF752_08935 [Pirellulaceae bacterium]|nr:hypothetical protein [Pirellulaceae bacterium]
MATRSKSTTSDPLDDPRYWTVQPGLAIGMLELGTPRDEVLQLLQKNGIDVEVDDTDSTEFYVCEMETVLYFAEHAPHPLLLIKVQDERVRLGTLKVIGDFPHNILAAVPSINTLWMSDIGQITSPDSKSSATKNLSDSQLLNDGTLWITTLGIGLGLVDGAIVTLWLCDPQYLPSSGQGEFTAQQRQLSEKMQLASFKAEVPKTHPVQRLAKVGLAATALVVAAYFGNQAWEEQKKWDSAPEVEAEVIEVWPPPPEPFPSQFTLSYQDATGGVHQVQWGQNDLYGMPQVGSKVTLRYLANAPDIAMGPAKLHDIAFNQFVPYLIGIFVVYSALSLVVNLVLAKLLRPA